MVTAIRRCRRQLGVEVPRADKPSDHRGFSAVGDGRRRAVEWAYKPSSVVCVHLSGTAVACSLMRPTRDSCSVGLTPASEEDSPPIWPCSGRGLASRCVSTPLVRSYRTISPLPTSRRAVCFCATFRRVAPPGCYPAPCPVELGLSSAAASDDRGRSAHSESIVAHSHRIFGMGTPGPCFCEAATSTLAISRPASRARGPRPW